MNALVVREAKPRRSKMNDLKEIFLDDSLDDYERINKCLEHDYTAALEIVKYLYRSQPDVSVEALSDTVLSFFQKIKHRDRILTVNPATFDTLAKVQNRRRKLRECDFETTVLTFAYAKYSVSRNLLYTFADFNFFNCCKYFTYVHSISAAFQCRQLKHEECFIAILMEQEGEEIVTYDFFKKLALIIESNLPDKQCILGELRKLKREMRNSIVLMLIHEPSFTPEILERLKIFQK